MSTYQKILGQLSGESLGDYHDAIIYIRDGVRQGSLDFQLDQEIIERTLAVFIFEKWSAWTEVIQLIDDLTEVLPHHGYMFTDFNDSHLLGGLAVFIDKLNTREIDTSGFSWLYIPGGKMVKALTRDFLNEEEEKAGTDEEYNDDSIVERLVGEFSRWFQLDHGHKY
jgi:hypothetical protein